MNADIQLIDNSLVVTGELNFHSIMDLWAKSLPLLSKATAWHFDFSRITGYQSVVLALLIEWIKLAKQQGKEISFHGVNNTVLAIAQLSGVESLIRAALL